MKLLRLRVSDRRYLTGGVFTQSVDGIRYELNRNIEVLKKLDRNWGCWGITGSENVLEYSGCNPNSDLKFQAYGKPVLRYVLMTRKGNEENVDGKIERGNPLRLVSPYPEAVKRIAAKVGFGYELVYQPNGTGESEDFYDPDGANADAIVEVCGTGESMLANNQRPVKWGGYIFNGFTFKEEKFPFGIILPESYRRMALGGVVSEGLGAPEAEIFPKPERN